MFSVKTENILLNYFVVLLTIGLLLLFSYSLTLAILFFALFLSGLLLYFDKYFFFKTSFLAIIIFTILFLLITENPKVLIILVLFISLSQLSLILTYFLFIFSFLVYFEFLEIYLVISIFILSLSFSFLLGVKKLKKDFVSKLFLTENQYCAFKHSLGNLYSILFFKNKDESLNPLLDEIRLNLNSEIFEKKKTDSSIAGLLRMTLFLLEYDYNLSVKGNFLIKSNNFPWVCFFYCLLENYVNKGATIVIQDDCVFLPFDIKKKKKLKIFLSKQLLSKKSEINGNILILNYGM